MWEYLGISHGMMSASQNTIMDMNNAMIIDKEVLVKTSPL
jgi:hypothetical protein